jgi:dTDP-4-dehydrorhamnose reductase
VASAPRDGLVPASYNGPPMTRVLVLGGSGMLGHKLTQTLAPRYETWATVRSEAVGPAVGEVLDESHTLTSVDADSPDTVAAAVRRVQPDVVINAIGIVKQLRTAKSAIPTIRINALLPHELAELCAAEGARLIQISTDCVFSGSRGVYSETDPPDPPDLYGRTKLLGEVADAPNALTIRTSIVGRELSGTVGLFEWFLSQGHGPVRGFSQAIFSGLTTQALAQLIGELIATEPDLTGLWHVSAAPIDKCTLLAGLRDALGLDVEIVPDDSLAIDRSLDSSRFRAETGWVPPSWETMLTDLAADPTPYARLRELAAVG